MSATAAPTSRTWRLALDLESLSDRPLPDAYEELAVDLHKDKPDVAQGNTSRRCDGSCGHRCGDASAGDGDGDSPRDHHHALPPLPPPTNDEGVPPSPPDASSSPASLQASMSRTSLDTGAGVGLNWSHAPSSIGPGRGRDTERPWVTTPRNDIGTTSAANRSCFVPEAVPRVSSTRAYEARLKHLLQTGELCHVDVTDVLEASVRSGARRRGRGGGAARRRSRSTPPVQRDPYVSTTSLSSSTGHVSAALGDEADDASGTLTEASGMAAARLAKHRRLGHRRSNSWNDQYKSQWRSLLGTSSTLVPPLSLRPGSSASGARNSARSSTSSRQRCSTAARRAFVEAMEAVATGNLAGFTRTHSKDALRSMALGAGGTLTQEVFARVVAVMRRQNMPMQRDDIVLEEQVSDRDLGAGAARPSVLLLLLSDARSPGAARRGAAELRFDAGRWRVHRVHWGTASVDVDAYTGALRAWRHQAIVGGSGLSWLMDQLVLAEAPQRGLVQPFNVAGRLLRPPFRDAASCDLAWCVAAAPAATEPLQCPLSSLDGAFAAAMRSRCAGDIGMFIATHSTSVCDEIRGESGLIERSLFEAFVSSSTQQAVTQASVAGCFQASHLGVLVLRGAGAKRVTGYAELMRSSTASSSWQLRKIVWNASRPIMERWLSRIAHLPSTQ